METKYKNLCSSVVCQKRNLLAMIRYNLLYLNIVFMTIEICYSRDLRIQNAMATDRGLQAPIVASRRAVKTRTIATINQGMEPPTAVAIGRDVKPPTTVATDQLPKLPTAMTIARDVKPLASVAIGQGMKSPDFVAPGRDMASLIKVNIPQRTNDEKSTKTDSLFGYTSGSSQTTLTTRVGILKRTTKETSTVTFNFVMVEFTRLQNWNDLCIMQFTHKNRVKLICRVINGTILNFVDFRSFTSKIKLNIGFDLEIRCIGGQIRFPYPFRADKLKGIYINNCTISDFRKEFKIQAIEHIPDTLEYVYIENSTISLEVLELYDSLSSANSPITRAAECGPENAGSIVKRNVNIIVKNLDQSNTTKLTRKEYVDSSNHYFNIQKKVCVYKYLKIFEISGTRYLEKNTVNKIVYSDEALNLKVLNFSRCGSHDTMYKLPSWRLQFPLMEVIDLSHNNIKAVPPITDFGDPLKSSSVGLIDLRYNNLSSITKEMIDSFARHRFVMVDIRHNPFRCDCGMVDIVQYIHSKQLPAIYGYLKSLACHWPKNIQGQPIFSLTREGQNCKIEAITNVPAIVLSIITLLLFTCIMLVIYFRNIIKVILYTRLNIQFPCHNKDSVNEKKRYDAFVAYSEKDADWVLRTVLPKIETGETEKSIKLCVHHRDFVIGAPIADNITQSVQNSYHTMLILSNDFLKSQWCMMEFRTALQKSLQERSQHLIVVIKDDLIFDNIDQELKKCLSTKTYLKTDDIFFWDKLIYAIKFKKD